MTHIIRFPLSTLPYPCRSTELETSEYVLLTAIRLWVDDHRSGVDPLPRLSEALGVAGVQDAAASIDQVMAIVARTARQPVGVHCPLCAGLSADEICLLHAASLAQAGEDQLAERALRTALLSAHGAACALGPLQGLAELFEEARLFLRRRLTSWRAPEALEMLH